MLISALEKIFATVRANGEAMGDQASLEFVGSGSDSSGNWWIYVGNSSRTDSPVFACRIDEEGQVRINEEEAFWSSGEI